MFRVLKLEDLPSRTGKSDSKLDVLGFVSCAVGFCWYFVPSTHWLASWKRKDPLFSGKSAQCFCFFKGFWPIRTKRPVGAHKFDHVTL